MPSLVKGGGHGHRIVRHGYDDYSISWRYDVKYTGSRLRFVRSIRRDTDRKGAIPPEPTT